MVPLVGGQVRSFRVLLLHPFDWILPDAVILAGFLVNLVSSFLPLVMLFFEEMVQDLGMAHGTSVANRGLG
jgi:hypothetical protein